MDIHVEDIEHFYNNSGQHSSKTQNSVKNLNTHNTHNNKNKINHVEDIPENHFSVNVVKQNKQVSFSQNTSPPIKQTQSIPKPYAKMSRSVQPPPKPQVTYDDILSKMGMFVMNGELHLKGNGQYNSPTNKPSSNDQQSIPQNSYIYNKYFKDAFNSEDEPERPKTLLEYRDMLVRDIIQKAKIRQIKSKKLIMPNSNINVAGGHSDLNKLFQFSQR